MTTLAKYCPNQDLPEQPCDRVQIHNPHEWEEDPTVAGPGMSIGTTYRCPGVWHPTTPDPDVELDDQLRDAEQNTPQAELARWWRRHAETEIGRTVAKAIDYGATDLLDLGHDLARMAGRTVTDQQAVEIGIAMYVRGKLARIVAAITEGREPNVDSWFDLGVYSKMAIRNREVGGWPGCYHQPS